ncbi:hypothetical protein EDB89DRAFT_2231576 [Lactarius sanguifluus]|nr:hypothetical protein EDB89DRAFT_2231576 [Lactarius sanguifluus]
MWLCRVESHGDKTFVLNSKSIPRVKTASDGFIRCIDFPPDGLFVTHLNKAHCFLDLWGRLRIIYVCSSPAFHLAQTTLPTPWARFLIQPPNYKGTCKSREIQTNGTRQVLKVHFSRSSSAERRLNKHYGPNMEVLGLVGSEWNGRDGIDEDGTDTALVEDPAKLISATLQAGDRARDLGYAPDDVSLRDAALVVRRSAQLSACAIATVAF